MAVSPQDIVIDSWAGLSHRPLLNPKDSTGGNIAPSWVGHANDRDVRRLNAYVVLASLRENTSRVFMRDETRKAENREYGDAAAIIDAILAAILGDDLSVVVDGADADKPEPPDNPTDPIEGERTEPDDGDDRTDETFAEELAEWETATARQEWIDEWDRSERTPLKIHETERNAVGLGDGIYLFAWDNEKRRVRCRVYDPGFYFPVLDSDDSDDYPDRVHLAWEYCDHDGQGNEVWRVRRITFERVRLETPKTYPYADGDDGPSNYTVLMTDGSWLRSELKAPHGVDSFLWDGVAYETNADGQELRDFDLGIDFIPVLHIPNTVALLDHFGVSALTRVCQVLDDIQGTDTDLQAASAITGAPPLSVNTPNAGQTQQSMYGPGTVFYGGTVTVADTSKSLDALLKLDESLLKRLSVNARVPEEVLGRVKAGDISSGIQLALSFGPFRSLIGEARLVRAEKYRLFYTFVQRLAIVGGALDKGAQPMTINVRFGSYMPSDQKLMVDTIVGLVKAHLMSTGTALKVLDAAGIDYGDDLADELEQIEKQDFEGALILANATGSEAAAREHLHLPGDDPNATPPGQAGTPPHPTPANAPVGAVPTVPVPAGPVVANGVTPHVP